MAASEIPMTELLTCRVTPTYGPTRRSATISRTRTAPLAEKTSVEASADGNARGGTPIDWGGRSEHRQVHVVGVHHRRPAAGAVRLPTRPGQPDLPVPDHVHHTQAVRVLDEVGRQPVAVLLVAAGRGDVLETGRVGREVAGPALGVLAAVLVPETGRVVGEAGRARLLIGVEQPRRDAAVGGRVVDRARLL